MVISMGIQEVVTRWQGKPLMELVLLPESEGGLVPGFTSSTLCPQHHLISLPASPPLCTGHPGPSGSS